MMTDFLSFVDDEIEIIESANDLFMLFHPLYACEGKLSRKQIRELHNSEVLIFVDNNILSPICEIIRNGSLTNKERLRKVASFVTLAKYLNASMTCGLALIENDTAGKASISAEENRQLFLYGMNKIPSNIWKQIALGKIDRIPDVFLKSYRFEHSAQKFSFNDELHYLCHKAALTKIVALLRSSEGDSFEKFYNFFDWFIDHLILSENMIAYAALVFSDQPYVAKPKKYNSTNYAKVVEGIENQTWDMFYLSQWSTFYYHEGNNQVFLFATDDRTTKEILKNSLPPGKVLDTIKRVYPDKNHRKMIDELYTAKLGKNRRRPFAPNESEKGVKIVNEIITKEMESLRKSFRDVEI